MGVRVASTATSSGLGLFSTAPARPPLTSFLEILTSVSQEEAPANGMMDSGAQTRGETSAAGLTASPQNETTLPSATDDESAPGTAKLQAINGPRSSTAQRSNGQENGHQAGSASIGAESGNSLHATSSGAGALILATDPVLSSYAPSSARAGTEGNSDQESIAKTTLQGIRAFAPVNPGVTLNSGTTATNLPQGRQQDRSRVSVPGERDASDAVTLTPVDQAKTGTAPKAAGPGNGRGMKSQPLAVVTGARPQATASAASALVSSTPVTPVFPPHLFVQPGPSGNSFQSAFAGASAHEVPRDRAVNPEAQANSEPSAVTRAASYQVNTASSSDNAGESIAAAAVALPVNQNAISMHVNSSVPRIGKLFGGISSPIANGEHQRASCVETDSSFASQGIAGDSSSRPVAWSIPTVGASQATIVGAVEAETSASGLMQSGAMPDAGGSKALASPQASISAMSAQLPVQTAASGIVNQRIITSAPQVQNSASSFAGLGAKTLDYEKRAVISAARANNSDSPQLPIQTAARVETPRQIMAAAMVSEGPQSTPTIAGTSTGSKFANMLQSAAPAVSDSVLLAPTQAGPSVRAIRQAVPATWETATQENILTGISAKTSTMATSVPVSSPKPAFSFSAQPQATTSASSETNHQTPVSLTEEGVPGNISVHAPFELSAAGSVATQQNPMPPPFVAANRNALGFVDSLPAEKHSLPLQSRAAQQDSAQIEDGWSGVAKVEVSRDAAQETNEQTSMPATVDAASAHSDLQAFPPRATPGPTAVRIPAPMLVNTLEALPAGTPDAQAFSQKLADTGLHELPNGPTAQTPDQVAVADAPLVSQVQAPSVAGTVPRAVASARGEEISVRDVLVPSAEAGATNGARDRQQPAIAPSLPENESPRIVAASNAEPVATLSSQNPNGQHNQPRTNVESPASTAGAVSFDVVPGGKDTQQEFIALRATADTAKFEQTAPATESLNQTELATVTVAAHPAAVSDNADAFSYQLAAIAAKPAAIAAQPTAVVDKRTTVVDKPAAFAAQPAAVTAKPAAVAYVANEPAFADKGAAVVDKRTTVVDKPAAFAAQPAAVTAKPAAVAYKDAFADKGAVVVAQPAVAADRDVALAEKPASVAAPPTIVAAQPIVVADQPTAVTAKLEAVNDQPAALVGNAASPSDSRAKLDNQPGNPAPAAEAIFAFPVALPMAAAPSKGENTLQPAKGSVEKATPGASNSRNPIVANNGNAETGKTSDRVSGSSAMPHGAQNSPQSPQATQTDPSHTTVTSPRATNSDVPQAQTQAPAQTQSTPVPAAFAAEAAHRASDIAETAGRFSEQLGVPAPMRSNGGEAVTTSSVNTAKLMQTLGESEMHVGMRSSEFGDISIRTSINQQQMVTRISLDHSDLSQAISAHVSTLQTKLGENFGLNASIEVHNLASSHSGEPGQSSQREQGALNQSAQAGGAQFVPEEESGITMEAPANAGNGNRLDIRA
jgi:hypothetical protein